MSDNRIIPAVSEEFEYVPPRVQVEYGDTSTPGYTTPPANPNAPIDPYSRVDYSGADAYSSSPFNTATLESFTIIDLVQMLVVYAFIIAAALSAIFIFVGGISFILSGGNDEKIKQAVNTIRYSIIGLIITILSFTFVTIVGRMFGLNFMDYLSYGQIKNSINQLISPNDQPSNDFEIQG